MFWSVVEWRFVGACGGGRSIGFVGDEFDDEWKGTSEAARARTNRATMRWRRAFTMALQLYVGPEEAGLRARGRDRQFKPAGDTATPVPDPKGCEGRRMTHAVTATKRNVGGCA